jgi:hypothetical protein
VIITAGAIAILGVGSYSTSVINAKIWDEAADNVDNVPETAKATNKERGAEERGAEEQRNATSNEQQMQQNATTTLYSPCLL